METYTFLNACYIFNKFGYRGYVRAIIDGRGNDFCEECNYFLKTIYGKRN